MNFNGKKLYKKRGGMLCGVCLGLADYLEMDVTVIRLITVLLGCSGAGFVAYIAAALIMPYEEDVR